MSRTKNALLCAAVLITSSPALAASPSVGSFGISIWVSNSPLAPTSGSMTGVSLPASSATAPATGMQTTSTSYSNVGETGKARGSYSFSGRTSGVAVGTFDNVAAPVASDSEAIEGRYLVTKGASSIILGGYSYTHARTLSFLWGSVSETDQVTLSNGRYSPVVTGADILRMAAEQGVSGNSGSYYVSIAFDRVSGEVPLAYQKYMGDTTGFYTFGFSGTAAAPMEVADLAFSTQTLTFPSGAPSGGSGTPVEAPAPVLGGTPTGALAAITVLGAVGLRRRRHAAAAA